MPSGLCGKLGGWTSPGLASGPEPHALPLLVFHNRPKNRIDAGRITRAETLEPLNDIPIEPGCDQLAAGRFAAASWFAVSSGMSLKSMPESSPPSCLALILPSAALCLVVSGLFKI